MKLPSTRYDHWFINVSTAYYDWQWLSCISGRCLLHHLPPDTVHWRCWGLNLGPSGVLPLSHSPAPSKGVLLACVTFKSGLIKYSSMSWYTQHYSPVQDMHGKQLLTLQQEMAREITGWLLFLLWLITNVILSQGICPWIMQGSNAILTAIKKRKDRP